MRKIKKEEHNSKTSNHRTVKLHEADAAEVIGGRAVGEKGPRQVDPARKIGRIRSDARSDRYEAECKQTGKQSMSFKLAWLEDITQLASNGHRIPIVFLRFLAASKAVEKDWVMLPLSEFKALREAVGGDLKPEDWQL